GKQRAFRWIEGLNARGQAIRRPMDELEGLFDPADLQNTEQRSEELGRVRDTAGTNVPLDPGAQQAPVVVVAARLDEPLLAPVEPEALEQDPTGLTNQRCHEVVRLPGGTHRQTFRGIEQLASK